MIISRCDRCCDGGGALAIRPSPAAPPPPRLPPPLSAYLGQCFNTPLTWLYWHTPDSVWWLMSMWVPLSLSLCLSLSFLLSLLLISLLSSFHCQNSTVWPISHTKPLELGRPHTHTKAHTRKNTHMHKKGSHTESHLHWKRMNINYTTPYTVIVCLIILFFLLIRGCLFIYSH